MKYITILLVGACILFGISSGAYFVQADNTTDSASIFFHNPIPEPLPLWQLWSGIVILVIIWGLLVGFLLSEIKPVKY